MTNTPTRWTPSNLTVHEQETAKRLLPVFQKLAVLRHLMDPASREFFERNGKDYEETGRLKNGPHFGTWCKEQLEVIKTKQSKERGVSLR